MQFGPLQSSLIVGQVLPVTLTGSSVTPLLAPPSASSVDLPLGLPLGSAHYTSCESALPALIDSLLVSQPTEPSMVLLWPYLSKSSVIPPPSLLTGSFTVSPLLHYLLTPPLILFPGFFWTRPHPPINCLVTPPLIPSGRFLLGSAHWHSWGPAPCATVLS